MKTFGHMLCVAVIVVCSLSGATTVAQSSLNVGNTPGYPGTTVTVPVTLNQMDTTGTALQFDLAFNSGKVSADVPVLTSRFTDHILKTREIAPGVVRTLVFSLSNAAIAGTNGPVLNIPFRVPPQEHVGSGPIVAQNVTVARTDATALTPLTTAPGSIFVQPVNRLPDGRVQFFLPTSEGSQYAIQATTDFVSWLNISTNIATGSFLDLIDPAAAQFRYRFYRWELLNP